MPLVHACSSPGCSTLTMGALCLEHERDASGHEQEPQRTRFLAVAAAAAAVAGFAAAFVARHV